jgi:hypothetical protein
MKKLFEEWGCLVLIVLAISSVVLANVRQNKKETKQVDEVQSDYAPSPLTFGGYECTEDCSGHEAGYQWAEDQGISDPDDCGGDSMSFEEGCRTYAEEQQQYEDEGYGDY